MIIDANITTLIAATVLYVIGTEQVRGFAVPLWLGVAISMFTSVFVARVIFDVAEKQRWITRLKMLRVIGVTKIDFMRLFPITATASLLITIGGVAVAMYRGVGLYDIDFTGGVSIQALFKKPQDTGKVREKLASLPDVAVSDVTLTGETSGKRFVVNTSRQDLDGVKKFLSQTFGDQLASNTMDASGVGPVTAPTIESAGPQLTPPTGGKEKPAAQPAVSAQPGAKPAPAAKKAEPPAKAAAPAKPAPSPEKPAEKPAAAKQAVAYRFAGAELPGRRRRQAGPLGRGREARRGQAGDTSPKRKRGCHETRAEASRQG